ncbi:MAG: hypothetical protein ACRES5_07315, partial [Pseudomonas sp.]
FHTSNIQRLSPITTTTTTIISVETPQQAQLDGDSVGEVRGLLMRVDQGALPGARLASGAVALSCSEQGWPLWRYAQTTRASSVKAADSRVPRVGVKTKFVVTAQPK